MSSNLHQTGEPRNFKSGAIRDNGTDKGMPSLMPTYALRLASKQYQAGAENYGKNNWRKGMPLGVLTDSLYRHLWGFIENAPDDPEDRETHLSALLWNAMGLAETWKRIEEGKLPKELNDLDEWNR